VVEWPLFARKADHEGTTTGDDLFDGFQTMMEGAIQLASYSGGGSVAEKSLFPPDYFDDLW